MKLVAKVAILALLTTSACGSSNQPGPQAIPHPPASNLTCAAEPDVNTSLTADPSGLAFDKGVRTAGQDCRDTVARTCRWHKRTGMKIDCPPALPGDPDFMKPATALAPWPATHKNAAPRLLG